MRSPWRSTRPLAVLGTGGTLPGEGISSEALVEHMATRFGYAGVRRAGAVADRLGVRTRHFCRPFAEQRESARRGQSNAALAAAAIGVALDQAQLVSGEIDYLIGHTTTPDRLLPAGIAAVADLLEYDGVHVELRQACTGFANALMIADGLIAADPSVRVAIVGSETGSLFFDPTELGDKAQLVNLLQMGDGAAAVILGGADRGRATVEAAWYGCTGLGRAPGISLKQGERRFAHDFAGIRAAGGALFEAGRDAAFMLGQSLADADIVVPHQASGRTAAQVAAHFGLPPERVFGNAARLGNTGSAAIWLALAELRRDGLPDGSKVVALGAEASKYMYGGFVYRHG